MKETCQKLVSIQLLRAHHSATTVKLIYFKITQQNCAMHKSLFRGVLHPHSTEVMRNKHIAMGGINGTNEAKNTAHK